MLQHFFGTMNIFLLKLWEDEKARNEELNLKAKYAEPWEWCSDGKRKWTYDEWMKEWPTYDDYKRAHSVKP